MTSDEFIERLKIAVEKSVEDLKPVMEEAALSGKALLARRVQNSGFGKKYISRGYKALRVKNNLPIEFVTLTFTGAMFQGWKLPDVVRNGFVITGRVAGLDKETQNKLSWNKSRYPTFDKSTDEEKELIKEGLLKPRIKAILQQNMTGR